MNLRYTSSNRDSHTYMDQLTGSYVHLCHLYPYMGSWEVTVSHYRETEERRTRYFGSFEKASKYAFAALGEFALIDAVERDEALSWGPLKEMLP